MKQDCTYWNGTRCTLDPKGILCECDPQRTTSGYGEWRPIETAPKDGRTIFIWYAGECIQAAYLADHHGRIPNWYLLDKWRNWAPVSDAPKFWMPLPEPPK